MIVDQKGRALSTRTAEEDEETLRKELAGLSQDEREALMLMLAELEEEPEEGEKQLIQLVSEAEYKHVPVDIETFVKDEYYLGNTCAVLYPQLLVDMKELFEGGEYQEAVLTGSIGWGKTFFASIGICRILYELSCMHDPHRSLGLAPETDISIVCLSVNEALAMKVAFDNVATKLKASPYFEESFPFKSTKKEFRFPHNVWLAARATTDSSALGLNVIGALLDETNFMDRGRKVDRRHGAVDHAELLYTGIMRRMKSRFGRSGKLPGMIFLVSSKKTKDDFTARRIRESRSDPHVFVRDYATWDVKPSEYYSAKKFFVICGNEQTPSRILEKGEEEELKDQVPDDVALIEVPEDFRFDFEHDLEGAIRDIAGVATVAISPFVQRREKLVFNAQRRHPFSVEVYDPSRPGTFLWEQMVRKTQIKDFSGHVHEALKPIVSPKAPRHIHIDPAYRKDAVGLCMGHISGWMDVVRRSEDGDVFQEQQPRFFVDLILQVVPPVGDEIVLGDLRRLVYSLSDHGYMITLVTMDTWQSVDSLQQFKQKGYAAEHLSVDTKMDPYENLKSAFYEDRVDIYNYPRLFKELRQLEKDEKKNKVDHPPKGSKDIADALAGCLYTLAKHQATQPLPILSGLSYSPDAWMEEQLHAAAAHQRGSSGAPGQRFYPENPHSAPGGYPLQVLPPVLGGGAGGPPRGGGGPDWGGGWNPSSL